jgi:hypothetical protein
MAFLEYRRSRVRLEDELGLVYSVQYDVYENRMFSVC